MILTIRYTKLYVLIVFSLILLQKLPAQNFEETINFADNQLNSGNLTTALKTYQRALFFSEGRKNQYLFSQIAEISFIKMDYETAQKYYGLAYNQSDNDSLKNVFLFNKAACQILNKNFQFAIIDLLSVSDTSGGVQNRLNFYLGTCYFGLEDFSNAYMYFQACIDVKDKKALTNLFTKKNLLSPSPKKARIMSIIIPGLGQAYSGDLKSALNSLLLTSGLIVLAINIGINYQPIDAVISILPWYQRYYTGGYIKSEEIARRKRASKRNEVYTKILKIINTNSN